MAFTPISAVYLLDVPLDNTQKNQLYFETVSAQYSYFTSKIVKSFNYVTYIRKDNKIRIQEEIDNLWNCNYIMYQNGNFANKWFYGFITRMEYVNENTTDLYVETDVFQSWLFDVTINKSFVVREHVRNDSIGANMIDERLDTGEYVTSEYKKLNWFGEKWNILAVSDNTPLGDTEKIGNLYGDVVTGLTYYPFPNTSSGITWLKNTIALYEEAGKVEAIVMIFTVPALAIINTINVPGWNVGKPILSEISGGLIESTLTQKPTSIDGYTPKNNKLFSYPYTFLYVSNSQGQSANYHYEYFDGNDIKFQLVASPAPSLQALLTPMNYKNTPRNYEYGLTLEGFPLGSWNSDSYNAWLANNSATTAVGIVAGIGAGIVGASTGNVAAAAGGALAAFHQIQQWYIASIQPDQAKGHTGSGSAKYSANILDFYYSKLNIRAEFAKRIDDFFTMYGYKVNTLKIPELHSRQYWNYVQTIDINIVGSIPADDMTKLKGIFDNGVTLWHSPANILNYDLNNTII